MGLGYGPRSSPGEVLSRRLQITSLLRRVCCGPLCTVRAGHPGSHVPLQAVVTEEGSAERPTSHPPRPHDNGVTVAPGDPADVRPRRAWAVSGRAQRGSHASAGCSGPGGRPQWRLRPPLPPIPIHLSFSGAPALGSTGRPDPPGAGGCRPAGRLGSRGRPGRPGGGGRRRAAGCGAPRRRRPLSGCLRGSG
jgi:hypothetical protein